MAYGEFREQHFPDLMKRLYHPMDNRTAKDSKQLAKLDPAIPLDKPFVFVYKYRRKDGTVKNTREFSKYPRTDLGIARQFCHTDQNGISKKCVYCGSVFYPKKYKEKVLL